METSSQEFVDVIVTDKISRITFGYAPHNSLSSSQLARLSETIRCEGQNPDSRVILVQSQGDKTFCAGANFDELKSIQTVEEAQTFFQGFGNLILSIRACPKPVIGRIQGKAVGGGVGLIAAMDYIFAVATASVRLSELSIGIGPYVIEPAISRKIGKGHFSTMALHPSHWQTASWANSVGLYQQVSPDVTALDGDVENYLKHMTGYSPAALGNLKSMLWENTGFWSDLLNERAHKSAQLLLEPATQAILHKL